MFYRALKDKQKKTVLVPCNEDGTTDHENFKQITKDWAAWSGDLGKNYVVLKHITCKEPNKNNFNVFAVNYAHISFDLTEVSICVSCGETVPEDLRKALLIHAMNIGLAL